MTTHERAARTARRITIGALLVASVLIAAAGWALHPAAGLLFSALPVVLVAGVFAMAAREIEAEEKRAHTEPLSPAERARAVDRIRRWS